jgi:beta-glucosidase
MEFRTMNERERDVSKEEAVMRVPQSMRGLAAAHVAMLACGWASPALSQEQDKPPYLHTALPIEERISDLLSRMTLEEKIDQVSGETYMNTRQNDRLGIPALKTADGPHGVTSVKATCFPTAISMASSWDTDLVARIGVALAEETRARGRNVILGPCVNIHRTPMGGRNFESFSEDPYLAARMTVSYVKGVQSQRIATSVKHYACNNQEWERDTINVEIDERTLREIYLPAFKAAVQEADAWTIMAAYNKVRGTWCCENKVLLTDILKNEWGFKGFVVSDWTAMHSTVDAANAGLDLEMPGPGRFFTAPLIEAVKNGDVSEATLDDKVRRILRVKFLLGLFDGKNQGEGALDTAEHRALARTAGAHGIVLLKNDRHILPLKRQAIRSLAVIGPNAAVARLGGGGSSGVSPFYSVSPLEGLQNKCGEKIAVRYSEGCQMVSSLTAIPSTHLTPTDGSEGQHGLRAEYFNNKELDGAPVLTRIDAQVDFDWGPGSPAPEINADGFSARWTGKLSPPSSGTYELGVTSDDGSRLYLDGQLLVDNWKDQGAATKSATVPLDAGRTYDIRVEYYENLGSAVAKLGWQPPGDPLAEASRIAAESDLAIVFAGLSSQFEGEGADRRDMALPGQQNALIKAVVRANTNTIVVLNNGTPLVMSEWIDNVPAVVEAWYPGQEGGHAIADVLFGDVNPSGKLPTTFPRRPEDSPSYGNYPGKDGVVRYAEGVFVGYRHFDSKHVEPLFPFGHGLSYTRFKYGDLNVNPRRDATGTHIQVSFNLQNVGDREGAEVVQLYVHDVEASVERPVKELKAFKKVNLKPGETQAVEFELDDTALAFYDTGRREWVAEPGEFEILIGSSSQDIRLSQLFTLAQESGK